jgi:hypothetical protein
VGPNPPPPAPSGPQPPLIGRPLQLAGGALWTTAGGKVPALQPGGSATLTPPNQVLRMDLRDGGMSTWFTGPEGHSIGFAGFDVQGHPVLTVVQVRSIAIGPTAPPDPAATFPLPSPPRLLLLTAPNETVELSAGSNPALALGGAFGDSHGIWLSSPGSLWPYRAGAVKKVADVPTSLFPAPSPPPGVQPQPGAPAKALPTPPPGYPTGPVLRLVGPCL